MKYKIYTDGGCSMNGNPEAIGGWGYAIVGEDDFLIKANYGATKSTTNQKMELTAAIEACKDISTIIDINKEWSDDHVTIYSDSAYLINCVNKLWYINWQSNGWRNSKKEPVANQELWIELLPFFNNLNFSFQKVAGHSGIYWNEYVDKLTKKARSEWNG